MKFPKGGRRSGGMCFPPAPPPVPITIVATNANFTVADSPVSGYKRITKVGGTDGTLERAASSSLPLRAGWTVTVMDPAFVDLFIAGLALAAGPFAGSMGSGIEPNGAGNATLLRWADGAYGGNFVSRVAGDVFSFKRNPSFIACLQNGVLAFNYFGTTGNSDASAPVIFDCALSSIGHYIDAKLS